MPFTFPSSTVCKKCSGELASGALVCDRCHTLVHAEELERLAAEARTLESNGELRQARERWLMGLPLLPNDSKQAGWIRDHAQALDKSANQAAISSSSENPWVKRLGPLGTVAVLLAKGKTLFLMVFKLKFLLSLGAFIAIYWQLYGPKFGVGFAVMILIHELGHFVDIKRRGLPAEMPVFLPGIGAYVKWAAMGVSLATRSAVSLAGPLAGWVASVGALVIWRYTGDGVWAALAHSGAWLNVLNLIPVWMLDGGQAALALSRVQRLLLVAAALGLGLALRENVFFLVALGATWRLFTKDLPEEPSASMTAYYIAVLALLGWIMFLVPGQGFGAR